MGHPIGIFMCKWDVPFQPQGYHGTSHWYFYVQVGCPIVASRLSADIYCNDFSMTLVTVIIVFYPSSPSPLIMVISHFSHLMCHAN